MYSKLKKEKAQEIVILLDLFEGKITLSELLNTDISLLNQLRDAKIELRNIQEKELNSKKSKTVQLTDPASLTKKGK